METRAIVFTYTGETVCKETLAKMVIALAEDTEIAGDVNTHCFTSDEIAKIVVSSIKNNNDQKGYNEAEHAFIYLAEITKGWIKHPFSSFMTQLASHVVELKLSGADDKFLNALRILSKYKIPMSVIRVQLTQKYLLSQEHISAFAKIGKNV